MDGIFLYIFIFLYLYPAATNSTAASTPSIEIISPFRHEVVTLMKNSIDGDKGVTMLVRYKINNFLVPRDGVIKVRSNALSQDGLFLSTYNEVKDGILTLHNVQAGTHIIYFQLIKYSDSSMKEGFEVYSTNTLFEVVPSKIRRFYPPSSSVISVVSEKLEVPGVLDSQNKPVQGILVQVEYQSFAHEYGLSELTKLYREKRMKKYRNKSKIRLLSSGH